MDRFVRVDHLSLEPGDGTRYRLVLSFTNGQLTIAWPDMRWSVGDLGRRAPDADWLWASASVGGRGRQGRDARPSQGECQVIAGVAQRWLAAVLIEEEQHRKVQGLLARQARARRDQSSRWADHQLDWIGDGGPIGSVDLEEG